ncbi:MAG: hypothetical protein CMJ38_05645 [Phycisphaerae bacterium]|nr:hypothetical protein [Phycisphaerae bacterium]
MDTFTTFAENWFVLSLLIGVALLIFGGNMLVDGGIAVAKHFGVSALVIGLTVVAFSTSSPELALNVIAVMNGNGELAIGNIFGSNIANLGLVLGIGALICKLPVTGQVVRIEFPILIAATIVVSALTYYTTDLKLWHACVFIAMFVIAMWNWFRLGKSKSSVMAGETEELTDCDTHSVWVGCLLLAGGLFLLGIGGKLTEIGAVTAATKMGISQLVIGVTVVAIATSLPEVVTTVIAAKKGHPDLAVGNVVGSNLFNMLFVLPISLFFGSIAVPSDIWVYLIAMCTITAVAYICAFNKRVKPIEGGVLLTLYAVFLITLVLLNT